MLMSNLIQSVVLIGAGNVAWHLGMALKKKKIDISDTVFTTGKFQGASVYRLDSADRLVCSVAGKVININRSSNICSK